MQKYERIFILRSRRDFLMMKHDIKDKTDLTARFLFIVPFRKGCLGDGELIKSLSFSLQEDKDLL